MGSRESPRFFIEGYNFPLSKVKIEEYLQMNSGKGYVQSVTLLIKASNTGVLLGILQQF